MSQEDIDYFRRRAASHREIELTATDPAVAAVHRELADRYEQFSRGRLLRAVPEFRSAFSW